MAIPTPEPGLIISYAYVWDHEAQAGQEEGRKDRPCVIALAVERQQDGETLVTVLRAVKKHLGLDDERSWNTSPPLQAATAIRGFALKPLPIDAYVFCEWRRCRVGLDYHVDAGSRYYSVPYRFARADIDVRLTARTVEIFLKGERIAAHMRMSGNRKHTTVAEHMPSSHRRYAGWTMERIRADARLIGPATASLCELILEQRPHPEQGFRACLGIVRLAGPYGAERLEGAAERAIDIGARTYGSIKSILDNNLDRRPAQKRATDGTPILHANIRGSRYYN